MIVTAWNNGKHHTSGAGYGFKVSKLDRDRFFKRNWKFIILELENHPQSIHVNIDKASFWSTECRELINKDVGLWLIFNSLAPWPKNKPPKLLMSQIFDNKFSIKSRET